MNSSTPIVPCPSKQELSDFYSKIFTDPERLKVLEEHISNCIKCQEEAKASGTPTNTTVFFANELPNDTKANFQADNATWVSAQGTGNPSNQTRPTDQTEIFQSGNTPIFPNKIGDFVILGILGKGGMGLVLEGEDPILKRRVAIKILHPEFGLIEKNRLRFLQEARAAAAIEHENIITIYQVGEQDKTPFIAMQLLRGESLADRIRRGPIPLNEIIRIGLEISRGLAAAHDNGLIHRDIKPDNIWLESTGTDLMWTRLKILDFGLARAVEHSDNSMTGAGIIMGTPYYMSPEQASGLNLDLSTDIFSFGVLLYQMVTGSYPFEGKTTLAVLTAVTNTSPRPIEKIDKSTPPALITLIFQMLEKPTKLRPKNCHQIESILKDIQENRSPNFLATNSNASKSIGRKSLAFIGVLIGLLLVSSFVFLFPALFPKDAIHVGVLCDLTGSLSQSGTSVKDATLFAIDEINARGGIRGRKIVPHNADGKSKPELYPELANKLMTEDKASVIFGCWTSASRKTLRPYLEKNDGLLLYPVQYEGMEESKNIMYLGPCPNQQILPAVSHAVNLMKKKKILIIGSEYVFPVAATEVIRLHVKSLNEISNSMVEILEPPVYLPLGETQMDKILARISKDEPDLILNTINGDTNTSFFRVLRAQRKFDNISTISFSVGKQELGNLDPASLVNDYVASSYFQNIESDANNRFVTELHKKSIHSITDPMVTAYNSVNLWAKAVDVAGTENIEKVRETIKIQSFEGPAGKIWFDPESNHAYRKFLLGKINPDGSFKIMNPENNNPIRPEPYPRYKSKEGWDKFLDDLFNQWNKNWQPVPS